MIDLSGMLWTVGIFGFKARSIFTGKYKKEKDIKEKSEPAPLLRTPNRAIYNSSLIKAVRTVGCFFSLVYTPEHTRVPC